MNSTDNHDKDNEYKRVEAELDPDPSLIDDQLSSYQKLTQIATKLETWFNNLPVPAKVAVSVVAIMLVFTILKAFLELIHALLSVMILGGLLYLLYRFLIKSQNSKPN